MKLEEIEAEAAKLSEEERAAFASSLPRSLKLPVYEVSDEEGEARCGEAEHDPSVWISFDALVGGLRRGGT